MRVLLPFIIVAGMVLLSSVIVYLSFKVGEIFGDAEFDVKSGIQKGDWRHGVGRGLYNFAYGHYTLRAARKLRREQISMARNPE